MCDREFASSLALKQHYRDKHGRDTSIEEETNNEPKVARGRKNRTKVRRRYGRKSKKKLLVIVLPILVAIIVVGVYYGSTRTNTPGNGTYGTGVGNIALDIPLTLANGTRTYLSSFEPHPVLLWFVTTWCTSCQQGAQLINSQYYDTLHSKGLEILTVESYDNLNQTGPTINQFAQQYGGGAGKSGWDYATSDWETTQKYNPLAQLDIFYVINQYGVITMENVGMPNYLDQIVSQLSAPANKPPFPFQCLGAEGTTIHLHPWLRIVINGHNITIPAAIGIENPQFQSYQLPGTNVVDKVAVSGSCFEPIHTHDDSGIIHIESPSASTEYTLGDFFRVWQATYGTVTIDGSAHPIVFNPTDILGFKADAAHKIVLLVDGRPSTEFSSLNLNQLDYCSASTNGPPCAPTAVGEPYYNGETYPFGTGHTIVIEYVSTGG